MPIIIVAGEEEYRIAREVEALKKRLVDPQWASFNFQRSSNCDLKQIIDAAATVPFGPGNKVVLFEDCALFTKKRGAKDDDASASKSKSDKLLDDLDAALKSLAPNTHLIFACIANFDKTLKVSKIFEKHAEIKSFDKVKYYPGDRNDKLLDFCNREAHHFDACIDEDACFYLAESTQVDLRQISSEIEKAAIYILPEKTIKLEHVTFLSPHFNDVFVLMEYWAAGRKADVLTTIKEIHAQHISPHMVIGAAQFVLTKWIHYKTEMERAIAVPAGSRDVGRREVPLGPVASRLAPNPKMAWMIEKDLKKITRISLEKLVQGKRDLTELEYSLKSGQMPEGHALEHFITR